MTTTTAPTDIAAFVYDKVGFKPTDGQKPIIACRKRFVLIAGGEQGGKSLTEEKLGLARMWEDESPGLYWLVAADYERTRAEFEYLAEDLAQLGVLARNGVSKRIDPGHIVLADGTRIETKSAKDPRTLAMKAPNGIIACEASQIDLETFERLRGRVAPKRGWLIMGGTFETSLGWYPALFKAWKNGVGEEQSFSLASPSNIHLYPGGINDPEIQRLKRLSSDQYFMERIMGEPVPPKGLVFGEFRVDIHVRDIEWQPGLPVSLWMDPGYAGAYAVLATQEVNGQLQVFDEVYEEGLVTEEVIEVCQSRPWWRDDRLREGTSVIDIYGYQHQAMTAPAEVWLKKTGLSLRAERVGVNDGIERMRSFLKPHPLTNEPKIVFSPKCRGILSEFGAQPNPFDGQTRAYRWKTDREGNIIGDAPEKKNDHGINAAIYGIVATYGYGHVRTGNTIKVRRYSTNGREKPRRHR